MNSPESKVHRAVQFIASTLTSGQELRILPNGEATLNGSPVDSEGVNKNFPSEIALKTSVTKYERPDGVLRRHGKIWTIEFNHASNPIKDSAGIFYLRELIRRQGTSIPATQLVTLRNGEPLNVFSEEELKAELDENGPLQTGESQEPLISHHAHRDIVKAIESAHEEYSSLAANGMAAEASEKLSEINNLELFLKKSTFRGRTGSFKNRPERARTSVKNAISRASEEINELNPTLARHLSVSIKTGYQCCYKPEKKMFWLM